MILSSALIRLINIVLGPTNIYNIFAIPIVFLSLSLRRSYHFFWGMPFVPRIFDLACQLRRRSKFSADRASFHLALICSCCFVMTALMCYCGFLQVFLCFFVFEFDLKVARQHFLHLNSLLTVPCIRFTCFDSPVADLQALAQSAQKKVPV